MLKKINFPNSYLTAGVIILSFLFLISFFGEQLAPYDIYELNDSPTTRTDPMTGIIESAPFAPSWSHWLGTDEVGIDLVSKLFYGAKYTLLVVITIGISRMLIGIPLGLIAGWWPRFFKTPSSYLSRAWSSIPLFLFVYIIISPIVNYGMGKEFQIYVLWLVLTFAGLPPIIETIRQHVETIKTYDFMDGVKVLGGGPFYILYKHILPHIKPYLVIIFSMEMAQILWLLGQLGIFHIFVGGTLSIYEDMTNITYYYSVTNEWAGLLGYGRRYYRTAPWIAIAPALAFTLGILGFQFLAEGLRRKMNKNMMKYNL